MRSPEARLAIEHASAVAHGTVLASGFGDEEVPRALLAAGAERVLVHETDLRAFRASARGTEDRTDVVYAPWVGGQSAILERAGEGPLPSAFDSAVLRLPKETDRLRMLLAMAAPIVSGEVVLVGHNDAGIRSAGRHLQDAAGGEPEVLGYRWHCRALRAPVRPGAAPFDARAWASTYRTEGGITVHSYPGVFSHGELDPGTAMLLDAVTLPEDARVLDVGCGSGVIAATVAERVEGKVHAVDVDAFALLSTWRTAAANGLDDRIACWGSDVYSDVTERYTHILANAPFHAGVRTSGEMASRLIDEARAHLEERGELWLVGNRFLDRGTALAGAFRRVDVIAEDRRYRVWRARL